MDLPTCKKQVPPSKKEYSVSEPVRRLIVEASELSDEDYHQLCCELVKKSPCSSTDLKKLMNFARDLSAKKKSNEAVTEACGHQSIDDPGTSQQLHDLPNLPLEKGAPASEVSLICKGDLVANRSIFFADTEKIIEGQSHKPKSGDLAIVDEKGTLVFWAYIKRNNVCMFNTRLTGLTKEKLDLGLEIPTVKCLLGKMFKEKVVWGADFKNDLLSLDYTNMNEVPFIMKDIQDFYRDSFNQPISMGILGEHFLGEAFHDGTHSSIKDARLTAICYRKMIKLKALGMERFACPVVDELRESARQNPKKKSFKGPFDKCQCGTGGKKSRKKQTNLSSMHTFNIEEWD